MIHDLQKASMWKRVSAFMFDAIMLAMLAIFIAMCLSFALGYDTHAEKVSSVIEKYAEQYGITDEMVLADANNTISEEDRAILQTADAAVEKDPEWQYASEMVSSLSLLITTLSLLLSFIGLEFAVPLAFGNGQTLGKKIFGVAVMHVNSVRVSHVAMFVRTVLGKYTVETMPFAMLAILLYNGSGPMVFALICTALVIIQLLLIIFTKENALIHDKMAMTVTVDLASQMIFDTEDEMLAFREKVRKEQETREEW